MTALTQVFKLITILFLVLLITETDIVTNFRNPFKCFLCAFCFNCYRKSIGCWWFCAINLDVWMSQLNRHGTSKHTCDNCLPFKIKREAESTCWLLLKNRTLENQIPALLPFHQCLELPWWNCVLHSLPPFSLSLSLSLKKFRYSWFQKWINSFSQGNKYFLPKRINTFSQKGVNTFSQMK